MVQNIRISKKIAILSIITLLFIVMFAFGIAFAQQLGKSEITSSFMGLSNGWNMVSVTPPMVNVNVSAMNEWTADSSLKCVSKQPLWMYKNNGWITIEPSNPKFSSEFYDDIHFDENDVGYGLWIKVENPNGCTLGCGKSSCLSGVKPGPKDQTK